MKEKVREVDIFDGDLYCPYREGNVRVAIPNMNEDIKQIRLAGGYSNLKLDQYGENQTAEFSEPIRATNKFMEIFMKHIESLIKLGAEPEVRFGVFNYYN